MCQKIDLPLTCEFANDIAVSGGGTATTFLSVWVISNSGKVGQHILYILTW